MANKITVELDLDTLAAEGKLKGFAVKSKKKGKEAATGFGSAFKKDLDSKMSSLGKLFTPLNVGLAATAASFAFVAKNASAAVGELRTFGRAVSNVNSILPANAKLTRESTNALNDFAAGFGTTNAKQADAFYSIVSAGVKGTAKQLNTLKSANEAAIAGLVDIDTSARLLVSSVNSYATSGLTAAKASDILFVAVREGQTTFGELAASLGNVAPVAASAGLKFEELAGAIAGITKAGVKTDVAVTGVRALLSSLIKVTPQAAAEAKKLGLEFSTAALKSKGLVGFMKDLQKATKGNEVSLGKLFPNVRALTPILQVVNGDFDDFARIQGEVKESLGATKLAADEVKKSLDFKLAQASSNFSILRQELAASFIPALGDAASAFSRFLTLQRDSASTTSKLEANIGNLKVNLEKWSGVMTSQGVPALQEYTTNATMAQKKVFLLTEQINSLQGAVKGIADQKLFDESAFGKLTNAKAELFDLENQLKNVDNTLINLEGKSQFELLGDITAKTEEIALLNEEFLKSTELTPKIKEATGEVFSLATSFTDLFSSMKIGFSEMSDGSDKSMAKIEKSAKQLGSTFKNSAAAAISGGIKNIINSIGKGENAFANFGSFMLQTIGDMAVKMGQVLIFTGLGIDSLKTLQGGAAIAAGIGLVAIGTILSNAGGGGESSSSSSSGGGGSFGGGGSSEPDEISDSDSIEERQTTTVVNLNVQGVVSGDKSEIASFIQDTLNEANEKNGLIQLNTRTA